MNRDPLCGSCRHRHPYGQAMAYYDDHGCAFCPRCDHFIDDDGECRTEGCCGNVWPTTTGSSGGAS